MVLSTELGISSELVVAAMSDRASVNSVAMRTVSVVYNHRMFFPHVGPRRGTYEDTSIRYILKEMD